MRLKYDVWTPVFPSFLSRSLCGFLQLWELGNGTSNPGVHRVVKRAPLFNPLLAFTVGFFGGAKCLLTNVAFAVCEAIVIPKATVLGR